MCPLAHVLVICTWFRYIKCKIILYGYLLTFMFGYFMYLIYAFFHIYYCDVSVFDLCWTKHIPKLRELGFCLELPIQGSADILHIQSSIKSIPAALFKLKWHNSHPRGNLSFTCTLHVVLFTRIYVVSFVVRFPNTQMSIWVVSVIVNFLWNTSVTFVSCFVVELSH